MALKPKLQLIQISDDLTTLVVADATGNYSSTNPGGFGAPNPTVGAIEGIVFRLTSYRDMCTTDAETYLTVGVGTYNLLASYFPSIAVDGKYPDGVYDLRYDVLYASTGAELTVIPGTNKFTLTAAATVFADAQGFSLVSDQNKVYTIDKTKVLDATGGYVTEVFEELADTTQPYLIVYEGILKFMVTQRGQDCLTRDIAQWSDMGCGPADFKNVGKRYKMTVAVQAKFDMQLYRDAHVLITKLLSYCGPCGEGTIIRNSNPPCGC